MKRTALLHVELSALIASLGHGDVVVIGDAGLPVPPGVARIDLAVTANLPRMHDVLGVVLQEMAVEGAVVADELAQRNPEVEGRVRELLLGVAIETISHAAFKAACATARAVVRTGEFSPYANVLLRAGVVF
ncbi:MAG: D-ribose pyranase [Proteobacteria bacterium]|nr:D-ribose pyranase [Pseudomonadota bacterium]